MKQTFYLAILVLLLGNSNTYSQQGVMLGDTILTFVPSLTYVSGSCVLELVNIGIKQHVVYGYIGYPEDRRGFYCFAKSTGVFYDTLSYYYASLDCIRYPRDFKMNVVANIIDSVTTVRVDRPTIIQQIDTSASQYLPNSIGAFFSMYNNVSDSSTFSNWQLVVSNSAKLTFRIDTAGTELSSYLMEPFTRKRQLNFTFTTELTPAKTERVFPAKLFTTVTTARKDSIYENALQFRFPALQPKGIHHMRGEDAITVSISPNPTELNSTLTFGHNKSETISIELYDVLGNRRTTLADGIYPSGIHTIPINTQDLQEGSYFIRLQTSGQVVTKKLIVR